MSLKTQNEIQAFIPLLVFWMVINTYHNMRRYCERACLFPWFFTWLGAGHCKLVSTELLPLALLWQHITEHQVLFKRLLFFTALIALVVDKEHVWYWWHVCLFVCQSIPPIQLLFGSSNICLGKFHIVTLGMTRFRDRWFVGASIQNYQPIYVIIKNIDIGEEFKICTLIRMPWCVAPIYFTVN